MNYFLIILSFFLTAFGQPAWIRGFGVLAAAFGFALFWKGMLSFPRPKDRFYLSVIWFSCVQGVQLSWMATTDYMGPFILAVYLFLILGVGIQFGILSFFFCPPIDFRKSLAIAGSWVLFEWMRLYFLCGFTWNHVGLALADSPYSLQFASIWGIFGLSFWVIFTNVMALNATSNKKIVAWAAVAFFPYVFGLVHQNLVEFANPISGHLKVALVQTALFPEQKERHFTSPDSYILPLVQLERILGVLDKERAVDLIVLPEAALPLGAHVDAYDYQTIRKYFAPDSLPPNPSGLKVSNAFLLQALANHFNAHVIAGLDDDNYNAAFHFSPNNLPFERYEKRILVPIGEYVPLRQWRRFSRFVAKQFGIYTSFKAGTKAKIFNTPHPIGISICLEETFSHLIRESRLLGAKLFVNVTNDIWFPRSKLPQQHFDHGRVRAAENGAPILRACNTGITGGVDCFGRPLEQLPASEKKAGSLYFTLPIRSHATLYTWWGDGAILAISAISLGSHFLFRKKKLP